MEHESIRKLKILQILLLIIRTLMVLCVVMMLTRPVVKGFFSWVNDPASTFTAIIIDDTFSNFGEGELYLRSEVQTQVFSSILENIKDDATINITSLNRGLQYTGRKGDLPPSLKSETISFGSGSFQDRFAGILSDIDRDYANKELFILSDGQAGNFQLTGSDSLALDGWNVYFYKYPVVKSNLAITNVKLLTEIPITNVPIELSVEVMNTGTEQITNALMQLIINDINVGQQVISLESGRRQNYIFRTAFHQIGRVRGVVELQSDNRVEDNRYYFHIDLPNRINIQLVNGGESGNLLFIRNVLQALNKDSLLLNIETASAGSMGSMDLRRKDVLIFNGVTQVSSGVQQKIINLLKDGGQFIVLPGPGDKELLDLSFLDINTSARLVNLKNDAFQMIDNNSIMNTAWEEILKVQMESPIKFFTYFSLADFQHSSLYLMTGDNIWNRHESWNGTVDVFGFASDLAWTNFPIRGSYIPFWHLLLYSNSSRSISPRLSTSDSWERILTPDELKNTISHVLPDGTTILLNPDGNHRIALQNIQQKGFNVLRSGERIITELAVNPPVEELISPILPNERLETLYNGQAVIIENQTDLTESIQSARLGLELWYWFLLALILLTICEMYLSNVYATKTS